MKAPDEERVWLASHNFNEATDRDGAIYYVGPLGHIIHLYDDGTWTSDRAEDGVSIEVYVMGVDAATNMRDQ